MAKEGLDIPEPDDEREVLSKKENIVCQHDRHLSDTRSFAVRTRELLAAWPLRVGKPTPGRSQLVARRLQSS